MATHGANTGPFGPFGKAYARKWSFLATFVLVLFVSYAVLGAFDLVPEESDAKEDRTELTASVAESLKEAPEKPVRVVIEEIDLEVEVLNPSSKDVKVLDQALLKGAVRYPTSAELGEEGNVILFGHSSYLPVVNNESFKAFNGIQNLEKGDRITVYGEDRAYVYEVETVSEEDAEQAAIPLVVDKPTLTLATCDSFGKKTDRFVVVATLVGSHPIGD